jgi:hypothetical protein
MPYILPQTAEGQWRLASPLGELGPWGREVKTVVGIEFSPDRIGSGRGFIAFALL